MVLVVEGGSRKLVRLSMSAQKLVGLMGLVMASDGNLSD